MTLSKYSFWQKKRRWVVCALAGIPLFMFIDHQLARIANERIAARNWDFVKNYNPEEIDWDDPNWEKCWERREFVFYKYKTCIVTPTMRDPRVADQQEKSFVYFSPVSAYTKWIMNTGTIGNFAGVDMAPKNVRHIFYLHKNRLIERNIGIGLHETGGEIAIREKVNLNLKGTVR